MKPGQTTEPSTSIDFLAGSSTVPTATTRSATMPTSATAAGLPEPSTTVPPRSTRSSTSAPGQKLVDRRFDDRPLEEGGIGARVEAAWVREGELGEGVLIHPAVVDHLPGLLQDLGHVRDVPVRDVRAHHGVELRAERVDLGVERQRGQRVVR